MREKERERVGKNRHDDDRNTREEGKDREHGYRGGNGERDRDIPSEEGRKDRPKGTATTVTDHTNATKTTNVSEATAASSAVAAAAVVVVEDKSRVSPVWRKLPKSVLEAPLKCPPEPKQ